MKPIGAETILFKREASRDPFGDPVPGTAVEKTIKGCATWPVSTSEEGFRGSDVTDDRIAAVPVAQSELGANWVAELDGRIYTIEGMPQHWRFLDGEVRGTQVKLKYQGEGNA